VAENKTYKDKIESIRQSLSDESIELIDFDELIELLADLSDKLENEKRTKKELEILKDDYRSRIIGMVKANLACRVNSRDQLLAARLADTSTEISSEELISTYGKVAARFRSNFPASFRYLTIPSQTFIADKNWQEHKI